MFGAGSVDLLGQRFADRCAFEGVAPLDRRVRAVAVGFVGRLAAAACDHAVADFVGAAVFAFRLPRISAGGAGSCGQPPEDRAAE